MMLPPPPLIIPGIIEELKPESCPGYRHWTYVVELAETMYYQGLLDRQEFLQWILETVEKCRYADDPIMRVVLPVVLAYNR